MNLRWSLSVCKPCNYGQISTGIWMDIFVFYNLYIWCCSPSIRGDGFALTPAPEKGEKGSRLHLDNMVLVSSYHGFETKALWFRMVSYQYSLRKWLVLTLSISKLHHTVRYQSPYLDHWPTIIYSIKSIIYRMYSAIKTSKLWATDTFFVTIIDFYLVLR